MGRPRGSTLLLRHCAQLERLTDGEEPNAAERLDAVLGSELARVLVGALSGDHRSPGRLGLVV
jgi:hypothetical protein